MSGKIFPFPGKIGFWLICMVVWAALAGCAPKLPASMSPEDYQTCDESAAKLMKWGDVDEPSSNAQPWLVTPGPVDITSPYHGSILPYGGPVVIKFTQPAANAGVLYRQYRILVTSLTGTDLDRIGDQYAVVTQPPESFQVNWSPPKAGKYILIVLIRNLQTIPELNGNTAWYGSDLAKAQYQMDDWNIDYGPFSFSYVCVQFDAPKVPTNTPKTMIILPLQNNTTPKPTLTKTITKTSTVTATFTFTPTFTATLFPTFTFTPLKPTFTATKPPTLVRPTDVPPTEVPPGIVCSNYETEDECKRFPDACIWEPQRTGGGVCKGL